jgi:hypothetical protein
LIVLEIAGMLRTDVDVGGREMPHKCWRPWWGDLLAIFFAAEILNRA